MKFLKCKTCGVIVGVIQEPTDGVPFCGGDLEELIPNTTDAAGEKGRNALYSRARELRREILEHSHFGPGRLLKAFPYMVHRDYDEVLRELRRDSKTDEKITEDEY